MYDSFGCRFYLVFWWTKSIHMLIMDWKIGLCLLLLLFFFNSLVPLPRLYLVLDFIAPPCVFPPYVRSLRVCPLRAYLNHSLDGPCFLNFFLKKNIKKGLGKKIY